MAQSNAAAEPAADVKEKIIVALDVDDPAKARDIVDELHAEVGAFKIGLQLFTHAGASFVQELAGRGLKIFLDLKFHDIPNTVAAASVEAARLGVWMFNMHALGGTEMMRRAAGETRETCVKENLKPPCIIGVTVLTSSVEQTLSATGIAGGVDEQVKRLARLTHDSGLDGVVASAREASMIRETIDDRGFLIVTPGVRPAGSNATNDDQRRVMTPEAAISAGADYLVIGRPITAAPDRRQAVRDIIRAGTSA
jgi:orotidine-5'-phosphate decarboxylase